jgi:hypothetical protein
MKENKLYIVEGIEGYYRYHLSEHNENCKPAICGNSHVMITGIPLSSWGIVSHLKERYCEHCDKIYSTNI